MIYFEGKLYTKEEWDKEVTKNRIASVFLPQIHNYFRKVENGEYTIPDQRKYIEAISKAIEIYKNKD
jgi:translation initiation factor RLI1